MGIKLVVIGAASSYTPELFYDLAEDPERLDVEQVTLIDLNEDKLKFIYDVCDRLIRKKNLDLKLVASTKLEKGIEGADFILPQIRVGGLNARVRDETLPMELDMVGNETTGAGGFVCAMRTVPVMLDIARQVERIAPDAWILNMSNPAGIVTEAICKHTKVRALGFCNIPINTTYALADLLNVDPATVRLDSFGLNHLSWTRKALVNGEDQLQALLDKAYDQDSILYQHGLVESHLTPEYLQTIRMIPSWYVRYFYYPELVMEEDRNEAHTKGVSDMQAEKELRAIYLSEGYNEQAQKILADKGGAQYYLPVLQAIDSIVNDRGDVVIVDTKNGTCMPDLPANVCVEVPARIYKDRVEPLQVGLMPLSVRGLVQTVKAYEELAIEAALTGSQKTAIAALMANPLVGTYPKARNFLNRVLENESDYLKPFYK
ncbi:MAG: family 4 glycosyl hydrolase [Anaerolineaceae bacterium]